VIAAKISEADSWVSSKNPILSQVTRIMHVREMMKMKLRRLRRRNLKVDFTAPVTRFITLSPSKILVAP
jgi:hypothetical protein